MALVSLLVVQARVICRRSVYHSAGLLSAAVGSKFDRTYKALMQVLKFL
jgi:hypothetical protein